VAEREALVNVMKICVKVACEYCEESLLLWVAPERTDVVVGMSRHSYYSDELSADSEGPMLLIKQYDVLCAARDEGWINHFRADDGLVCPKCRSK
jgi:hypothetical protein